MQTLTAPAVMARKGGQSRLVMVTAYDAPSARMAEEAGVDMVLVGDSVAMTVLGHDDTLAVTVEDIAHHTGAVARGIAHYHGTAGGSGTRPLIVADLPWLSYHTGTSEAVRNAGRLVHAGARAVKLEGGTKRLRVVQAILDAEIPVMGHLGLTPQSVHALGGFKVQGRSSGAAEYFATEATALAEAGCFALVLEGMPMEVARYVTDNVAIPTIGIGAGAHCDGQVLVFHDLLGLGDAKVPKFVRSYAAIWPEAVDAIKSWASDVRGGQFPSEAESY